MALVVLGVILWFASAKTGDLNIMVAAASPAVVLITYIISEYLNRKREVEALHREQKREIYSGFVVDLLAVLQKRASQPPDLVEFFKDLTPKLVLWSSGDLIDAFNTWKVEIAKGDLQAIMHTEALLDVIRRELGHTRKSRFWFAKILLRDGDAFVADFKRNPRKLLRDFEK